MRLLAAFSTATTMLISSDRLLRDWCRGRFVSTKINFHDKVIDLNTRTVSTGVASFDIQTLAPSYYKRGWANAKRQRVWVSRDNVVHTSDYDPHLNLHVSWTPDRIMTDAMPVHIESDMTILCSSQFILNRTLIDTKATPTCGDLVMDTAVVGTMEGRILVYEGTELQTTFQCMTTSPITAIRLSGSRRLLATGHADGIIRMHALSSSRQFDVRQVIVKNYHTPGIPIRRIRLTEGRMASVADDGVIHVASPAGNRLWWSRDGILFDLDLHKLVVARDSMVEILTMKDTEEVF